MKYKFYLCPKKLSKTRSWSCYVNVPSLNTLYALFDENANVVERKYASISRPKSTVTYKLKRESNPEFFENLYLRHGNTTYNTTTWKQVGFDFSPEFEIASMSLTYDTIFGIKSSPWEGESLDKENPKEITKSLLISLDGSFVSITYNVLKKTYFVMFRNKERKTFEANTYFTKPAKATK